MNANIPLACNMNVFTPAQREQHIQTTRQLIQEVQNIQSVEHGYQFNFPNETEFISKIAEFISNERLCCPFLVFNLTVSTMHEPVSLTLSGPAGTQQFLREEFSGAFE